MLVIDRRGRGKPTECVKRTINAPPDQVAFGSPLIEILSGARGSSP